MARAIYYNRLAGLPAVLADDLYLGFSLEAGNAWLSPQTIDFDELRYGVSAFVGLRTVIGPVHLAVAVGEDNRVEYYFTLGRTF